MTGVAITRSDCTSDVSDVSAAVGQLSYAWHAGISTTLSI